MKHRIRRIGVLKAALMGGIGYAIIGLLFMPLFFFVSMLPQGPGPYGMEDDWMFGPVFALLLPVLYGGMGFIGTAVAAAVYNLIAMMVGGLEVDLEPVDHVGA
jgi:hypothetical protein